MRHGFPRDGNDHPAVICTPVVRAGRSSSVRNHIAPRDVSVGSPAARRRPSAGSAVIFDAGERHGFQRPAELASCCTQVRKARTLTAKSHGCHEHGVPKQSVIVFVICGCVSSLKFRMVRDLGTKSKCQQPRRNLIPWNVGICRACVSFLPSRMPFALVRVSGGERLALNIWLTPWL